MPKKADTNCRIGFFPGNWDLLHPSHIKALEQAKKKCDFLYVGVKKSNKDKPGKNEPIIHWRDRCYMLKALRCVDRVFTYEDEKALYVADAKNDYIRFMGSDHKGRKHHYIKGKIVYIRSDNRYHTSKLREKIWIIENKKF